MPPYTQVLPQFIENMYFLQYFTKKINMIFNPYNAQTGEQNPALKQKGFS